VKPPAPTTPTKESRRVNDDRDSVSGRRASIRAEASPAEEPDLADARGDKIGVGSGDENVAKIQLAARWTENYAPPGGDTLEDALRRFKRAYYYVDSVTKLVEPDES
jgi:hypothetical protein